MPAEVLSLLEQVWDQLQITNVMLQMITLNIKFNHQNHFQDKLVLRFISY